MGKRVAFNLDDKPTAEVGDLPAADLSAIGASLVDEIPEPQQHAIDQATADSVDDGAPIDGAMELDALGIPYNADIHAKGADGKGIKTTKGTWRKRRGVSGSPSQLNTGRSTANSETAAPAPTAQQTTEDQCRIAGAMMGTLMTRLSVGIGGNAFLPRILAIPGIKDGINEQDMLNAAWGDYFVSRGITDLPPSAALLGALSMYYLPRLQDQQVREKVGGFFGWFKEKITRVAVWWKYRKGGSKVPKKSKVSAAEREGATDAETSDVNE